MARLISESPLGNRWCRCHLSYRRVPEQLPENLSRKGFVPIIGEPRCVTSAVHIFVVVYCWRPSYADPETAFSRRRPADLRHLRKAHQRRPRLPPCPSCAPRRQRAASDDTLRRAPVSLLCPAQVGLSFCASGYAGSRRPPTLWAPPQSHMRVGTVPQSSRRSRPPGARFHLFPMELSRTRDRLSPRDMHPAGAAQRPGGAHRTPRT